MRETRRWLGGGVLTTRRGCAPPPCGRAWLAELPRLCSPSPSPSPCPSPCPFLYQFLCLSPLLPPRLAGDRGSRYRQALGTGPWRCEAGSLAEPARPSPLACPAGVTPRHQPLPHSSLQLWAWHHYLLLLPASAAHSQPCLLAVWTRRLACDGGKRLTVARRWQRRLVELRCLHRPGRSQLSCCEGCHR